MICIVTGLCCFSDVVSKTAQPCRMLKYAPVCLTAAWLTSLQYQSHCYYRKRLSRSRKLRYLAQGKRIDKMLHLTRTRTVQSLERSVVKKIITVSTAVQCSMPFFNPGDCRLKDGTVLDSCNVHGQCYAARTWLCPHGMAIGCCRS